MQTNNKSQHVDINDTNAPMKAYIEKFRTTIYCNSSSEGRKKNAEKESKETLLLRQCMRRANNKLILRGNVIIYSTDDSGSQLT